MKGMQTLRQDERYTDVTLQSGDVQIQCHRVVLEAASDYFRTMFTCGLKESTSDTVSFAMDPEILTKVVHYIYTSEIDLTIDSVESLVRAGDLIQLDCLKSCCEDFIVEHVDTQNCVGFYRFATLYRLDKLQKKAKQLICADFKTVASNAEFKELTCSEVVEHIQYDDVRVESEDVVFEAVLNWFRHDIENRKSSLETIFEHVRLPYCSSNCLWRTKDIRDLLTPKCTEYIHEAMAFQTDAVHHHGIYSTRTVPRTNFRKKSCLLVVGGLTVVDGKQVNDNHCQYYNEATSCWESLMSPPSSVGRLYSVCHVDGGLLLTGGRMINVQNKCWLYNMVTKQWEAMPPLITARSYHSSVLMGECAYVVGGKGDGEKVLESFECLNLNRRQWTAMPDMPQAVFASMVASYDNNVFVFGGRDSSDDDLVCSHVFNTTQSQWSTLSDMPDVCSIGAAVTLNDCMFVVGGFGCTCLEYSPALDTWTRLNEPDQDHGHAPAVVWRGKILVAGGNGANQESIGSEQYDPLTNTWSEANIALPKAPLLCHCMFVVDLYSV